MNILLIPYSDILRNRFISIEIFFLRSLISRHQHTIFIGSKMEFCIKIIIFANKSEESKNQERNEIQSTYATARKFSNWSIWPSENLEKYSHQSHFSFGMSRFKQTMDEKKWHNYPIDKITMVSDSNSATLICILIGLATVFCWVIKWR